MFGAQEPSDGQTPLAAFSPGTRPCLASPTPRLYNSCPSKLLLSRSKMSTAGTSLVVEWLKNSGIAGGTDNPWAEK